MLLEEAARTFTKLDREQIATYVTVEDFQYYWQRANDRISLGGSAEALVTLYSHFYFSVTILVTIVTRNLDFFCDGKLRQLPPPGVRLIHERFLK